MTLYLSVADAQARGSAEPVFFHTYPIALDEELIHSYDLSAVIDLSVGAGNVALSCIRQRRPYFGVTLTECHSAELIEWLTARVWASFMDEASPLYIAEVAKIVAEAENPTTAAGDNDGGDNKAKKSKTEKTQKKKAATVDDPEKPAAKKSKTKKEVKPKAAPKTHTHERHP